MTGQKSSMHIILWLSSRNHWKNRKSSFVCHLVVDNKQSEELTRCVSILISVIGHFLSLDHVYATVFRSTFANLILVYCNSIERYKRFCKNVFVRFEIRDFVTLSLYTWWLFDYRRYRNVMCLFLLTYLHSWNHLYNNSRSFEMALIDSRNTISY